MSCRLLDTPKFTRTHQNRYRDHVSVSYRIRVCTTYYLRNQVNHDNVNYMSQDYGRSLCLYFPTVDPMFILPYSRSYVSPLHLSPILYGAIIPSFHKLNQCGHWGKLSYLQTGLLSFVATASKPYQVHGCLRPIIFHDEQCDKWSWNFGQLGSLHNLDFHLVVGILFMGKGLTMTKMTTHCECVTKKHSCNMVHEILEGKKICDFMKNCNMKAK